MNKLIILAFVLSSCTKEVVTKEPIKDCNCDRIVNIVRAKYDYNGHKKFWATITTINDCSNWQKQFNYIDTMAQYYKKEGDCY